MLQKVRENNYMRLARMGSRYPSRLSFSRSMLRRLINDKWKIKKSRFDLEKNGYGTVVYEIIINNDTYSLVCFSAFLDDKDRSDRVIASKWDTAYTLHVGKLTDEELTKICADAFPLRPGEIVEHLDLKKPRYYETSSYGHFGRNGDNFTWELTDLVEKLRSAAKIKRS